jgi:uncharacterized protein (TIGR02246 family)
MFAKYLVFGLLMLSPVTTWSQTANDRRAVEMIPTQFLDAWAKHDGHALAQIMAENSDFITVGGAWFHGRKDIETYHSRLLSGRFRDAAMTLIERKVDFIRPDLGFVRWSWRMEGDKNADGTLRPPRAGIMTMLAEKQGSIWRVITAQNTNAGLGNAPELEGIASPITLPKGQQ